MCPRFVSTSVLLGFKSFGSTLLPLDCADGRMQLREDARDPLQADGPDLIHVPEQDRAPRSAQGHVQRACTRMRCRSRPST